MKIHALIIALLMVVVAGPLEAEPVRLGHVQAELVSPNVTIQPGRPFMVGLRLAMDDEWHVYWRNPGDAGIPPSLDWDLPEGFEASEIQWPVPERFAVPPLMSYGYHHEVLLPVMITPPERLDKGETYRFVAKADWLVCKVECIPGSAELELRMSAGEVARVDSSRLGAIERALLRVPVKDHGWRAAASVTKSGVTVLLDGEAAAMIPDSLVFLPYDQKLIVNAAPQVVTRDGGEVTIEVPRSRHSLDVPAVVEGIVYAPGSDEFVPLEVSAPVASGTTVVAATDGVTALWQALLFALLGGMILNLMPCVLPVLSLKVLSFVKQAGDGKSALGHGLLFTAGVLASFWLLAGVLLILQAGGEQLGWGFQLQSPAFLMVLSGFMFLFGLNLFGVFEVGNSLTGLGSGGASRGGGTGSFVAGVTATVVATPCTAPFMGSALGFSLSQPWWAALTIFTFLGLGMAAPYLVLSAWPALLRFVPKPGAWMETLKQALGFVLMATVIWLAWVLSLQTGPEGVVILMAVLLVLGIAGWVLGRFGSLSRGTLSRRMGYAVAIVLIVGAVATGISSVDSVAPSAGATGGSDLDLWQPYSPERVNELRAEGRPVFIDFTAAWCLSCQVNKRVALRTTVVEEKFAEAGVSLMVADWTSRNETITRALAEFGRNSVPLYVLYPGSPDSAPIILPEILTEGIVLEALDAVDPPRLGVN